MYFSNYYRFSYSYAASSRIEFHYIVSRGNRYIWKRFCEFDVEFLWFSCITFSAFYCSHLCRDLISASFYYLSRIPSRTVACTEFMWEERTEHIGHKVARTETIRYHSQIMMVSSGLCSSHRRSLFVTLFNRGSVSNNTALYLCNVNLKSTASLLPHFSYTYI